MSVNRIFHFKLEIDKISRCPSNDWPLNSKNFTCYNFCSHFLFVFILRNILLFKKLIARLTKFILRVKIYPHLEAIAVYIPASWHFSMYDTFSSSHPLDITRTTSATMPIKIFVQNFTFDHVSNSLETSVRVVRESGWKSTLEKI